MGSQLNEILKSLGDHKQLKILDISHNGLKDMQQISDLIIKNQTIQELNLKGNYIWDHENLECLLMAMIQNTSITKLEYELKQSPSGLLENY